jgi:hypothetical protein
MASYAAYFALLVNFRRQTLEMMMMNYGIVARAEIAWTHELMSGEVAYVAHLVVADEDVSWHMLSGELAHIVAVVVVADIPAGFVMKTFAATIIPCLALLQLGTATSFVRSEIGLEMRPRLGPELHCQL